MEGRSRINWVEKLVGGEDQLPADTASANLIGRIIAAAVARGASRPALLEAIGLTESVIRNQLRRVPGQVLIELFQAIEQQLGNPAIALEIGRDSQPHCFSDIGFSTRMLETLFLVLTSNIELQVLRQNLYRVTLVEIDDTVEIRWNILHRKADEVAAAVEFSVATYLRLAREICGNDLALKGISLQHRQRCVSGIYADHLGHVPVFEAAQTAIILDRSQCHAPSRNANPALYDEAGQRHHKAVEWAEAGHRNSALTYFHILTELNKSPVTLDRIARSLGVAERTLRRNLVVEGNPFRTLLDNSRKGLCDLYRMEGRRTLSEVAILLGYGELSAFTRAYRRWYGEPPSRNWGMNGKNGGRSKD
jgi:AraC-like DNA-binding protein